MNVVHLPTIYDVTYTACCSRIRRVDEGWDEQTGMQQDLRTFTAGDSDLQQMKTAMSKRSADQNTEISDKLHQNTFYSQS